MQKGQRKAKAKRRVLMVVHGITRYRLGSDWWVESTLRGYPSTRASILPGVDEGEFGAEHFSQGGEHAGVLGIFEFGVVGDEVEGVLTGGFEE